MEQDLQRNKSWWSDWRTSRHF